MYDDPLGVTNPTLYCDRCFLLLHPDSQDLGSSSLFPYIRYENGGAEDEAGGEVL